MGFKVISPPAPMLAIADLRLHLKLDAVAGVHPDDALVLSLADAAIDFCEHACDRSFGAQTLELALDQFPCTEAIALPRGPVQSITHIKYIDTASVEQTLAPSAYMLDDYSPTTFVVPALDTTWPDTLATVNAVKIRYLSGTAALPPTIRAAALLLVGHWYEHREAVAAGNWGEMPMGVRALLDTQRDYSRYLGA